MQLSIRDLTFAYPGGEPVFEHLNLNLDTGWRLGVIGRNGRGKTTLLRLMMGRMPLEGAIDLPLEAVYFPYEVSDASLPALEVLRRAAPGAEEWRILREWKLLGVTEEALDRPFGTLSKGEQTKALLSALFAREDAYPLIDEPTSHLDVHGRELVARYLRRKDGFLLVSHDRAFLNSCVDHVLALNRSDAWVMQGDYDAWQERFDQQNAWEEARNEDLKRDIVRLEASARRAARWSDRCEKGKFHVAPSETAAVDRGYVGARSAALMKRSANTQRRRERAVEERRGLLHNVERVGELRLTVLRHPKETLVRVEEGVVRYDGRGYALTSAEGTAWR